MDEIITAVRGGIARVVRGSDDGDGVPDGTFTLERHPHREILFVASGRSLFALNGRIFKADRGDVFVIEKWMSHSYGYRECDTGLLHVWFHVSEHFISVSVVSVDHGGVFRSVGHVTVDPGLGGVFSRRLDKGLPIENTLSLLLEETCEAFDAVDSTCGEGIACAVKRYIESVNARGCSLRSLALIHRCSQSQIAHRFRDTFGMSVGDCVDSVRLQYSESAFRHGLTRKETSADLGFSSPSAFCRWLKKMRSR